MSENNLFSYTQRDYEGSRKEGLSKIPTLSNGVWTDLNITDPGIIILDYVHALVDMINYYQDHQALEAFIPTAKERANLFRLAYQLGYKVRSAKGAKVTVTFSLDFYYDEIIKIPKYTGVSTADHIQYLTLEDAYIPVGESEIDIVCVQGKVYKKTYEGTGLSRFSILEDTISENQYITLTTPNIDTESIEIVNKQGMVWSPVDYITYSTGEDRVYQVDLNANGTVTIKFGDGERGMIPQENEILNITYRVSDAEAGAIGVGAIIYHEELNVSDGRYLDFDVTNKEPSIGGVSPQSSSSIKELAPGAIKAQGRAVTIEDFENLARLIPGVYDVKAYDVNNKPDLNYHEVQVVVIPETDHPSNDLLLDDVYKYLYKKMIPPTNLSVIIPTDVPIDIKIVVKKFDTITDEALRYKIESIVKDYFENRKGSIGEDFYPTDLSAKIANITEVRSIVSMSPEDTIEILDLQRAVNNDVKVEFQ